MARNGARTCLRIARSSSWGKRLPGVSSRADTKATEAERPEQAVPVHLQICQRSNDPTRVYNLSSMLIGVCESVAKPQHQR